MRVRDMNFLETMSALSEKEKQKLAKRYSPLWPFALFPWQHIQQSDARFFEKSEFSQTNLCLTVF
jgi:hypothetical protein